MTVVRHAGARRSETLSAVMTTLASPTQGGAQMAVWRVEVQPGIQGPEHVIDAEQVWTSQHCNRAMPDPTTSTRIKRSDPILPTATKGPGEHATTDSDVLLARDVEACGSPTEGHLYFPARYMYVTAVDPDVW